MVTILQFYTILYFIKVQRLHPGDGGGGKQGTNTRHKGGQVEVDWPGRLSGWYKSFSLSFSKFHKILSNLSLDRLCGNLQSLRSHGSGFSHWINCHNTLTLWNTTMNRKLSIYPKRLGATRTCWGWKGTTLSTATTYICIFLLAPSKRLHSKVYFAP